jgi:hypothetical protein
LVLRPCSSLPDDVVDKERKANTSDPQSRIMKTRLGCVQGYNAQAADASWTRMYKKRGLSDRAGVRTEQDGARRRAAHEARTEANRSEWRFTCGAHNLLKLWRGKRKPGK